MKKLLQLILTFLCFTSISLAQDIYVNVNATGANNGSSWTDAYIDLQDAIDAATANQEIWVAAGTYLPTKDHLGNSTPADNQDKNFHINTDMKIYGGFTGTETALNQRDWTNNATILSGDIGTEGNNTDNSYHVFITANLTSAAVIDGFTIQNGSANGSGSINFSGSSFNKDEGGGMGNSSSSPTVTNMTFVSNTAYNGGGMSNNSSSPAVTNVTFMSNTASSYGGGMSNTSSSPTVTNVTFVSNTTSDLGGGMYNNQSSPTVTNVTFVSNTATLGIGGGVCNIDNSSPTVTNVAFVSNTAKNGGGGMSNNSSSPTVNNVTFVSNTVAQGTGGGMNNVFSSSPTVTNSIFWDNKINASTTSLGADIENLFSSTPVVTYTSLQSYTGGTGCITGDPLFVDATDADGADDVWMTADDGLRLIIGSPAMDAGINDSIPEGITTDITGAARIQNTSVNMGAYEGVGCSPTTTFYVDSTKAASGDGSSWSTAFKTLSEAIDRVCTNTDSILVAAGTYLPTSKPTGVTSTDDRDVTFYLNKDIVLLGGYPAGGGTRDAAANPTILSGDIGVVGDSLDNSYHVLITAGLSSAAVIDGFTVRDGNANGGGAITFGSDFYKGLGGGMSNINSSPSATNMSFVYNASYNGGGMYNNSASPSMVNVIFASNTANNAGGGIFNESSYPKLTNVTFTTNMANFGGGMFNYVSSSSSVTNCIFWANKKGTSTTTAGADIENISSAPVVTYTSLQNYAGGTGAINGDPLFVDAANGDFRLLACSPAINMGTAVSHTTDILGNPHFGTVDMGAYEYQGNPFSGTAIYVKKDAAGTNDGSSWANAYTDLQDAIDNQCNGLDIWVAAGTYYPSSSPDEISTDPRDKSFHIATDMKIYGGFNGTETALSQRDWESNVTILSGDFDGNDVVTGAGSSLSFTNNEENAIHVLITADLTTSSIIDGFTITKGNANVSPGAITYQSKSFFGSLGGGLYNSTSSPFITNTTFVNNNTDFHGGAMSNYGSSPSITNSVFANNNADRNGGGIYNEFSSPAITNTTFVNNNAALKGGGIYNIQFSPTIANTIFWENTQLGGNAVAGADISDNGSATNATYSLTQENSDFSTGTGIINNEDPLFVDAANGDFRLQACSPVIDKGTADTTGLNLGLIDLAGNPRVLDGRIDMGAYEGASVGLATATDLLTWTGAVDTVWNNACNWSPAGIPTATNDVVIPGGLPNQPTLSINNAVASTVEVKNGATFTIASGGKLELNGSKAMNSRISSFSNTGTVNNNGDLYIGNLATVGQFGLHNISIFNNNAGGTISIDSTTLEALYNSAGEFTNSSNITIGGNSSIGQYGLHNLSTFINTADGKIIIDNSYNTGFYSESGIITNSAEIILGTNASVGYDGLQNRGTFNNINNGKISIDSCSSRGLANIGGFVNSAEIILGVKSTSGASGIVNYNSFINNAEGVIKIDKTTKIGIENGTNPTTTSDFLNSGKISIGKNNLIGHYGIQNISNFNNKLGGLIEIENSSIAGLYNLLGSFTNADSIIIGRNTLVGATGILNDRAIFTNEIEGIINIDNSTSSALHNFTAATFNNSAKITLGANASVGNYGLINESTFNNNTGAEVNIDNTAAAGLNNQENTFTNHAKITIGANSFVGAYGLENNAIFNNNTGGDIKIDKSGTRGLSNENGVFTNAAKITIGANGPVGQYGLYSSANFNNNTGGEINIDNATDDGLTINSGVLTNEAKITLGGIASPGFNGIFNRATFNNNAGGYIKIDNSSGIGFFNAFGTFNNHAKVSIGANASIGEYGIRSNSAFNNNLGGEINIDNSTEAGLFHDGLETFQNYSKITIGANALVGKYGLVNESTFNNNAGGEINIDSTTNTGLVNRLALSGIFTNAAKINIGTNASVGLEGISNIAIFNNISGGEINIDNSGARAFSSISGTVNNSAKLTIGANAPAGYIGLYTEGIFNNNTDGEITIDSTSSIGLWHVTNTFTNQAKITIGSIASVGTSGLQNTATFNNNAGGEINIDNASLTGLNNQGTFTNVTKLTIGAISAVGDNGILNKATFNNNTDGDISIDRSSNIGLLNQAGSFTNAAKITIGSNASVGTFGIFNDAIFNNITGGDINIDNTATFDIINQNGEFTNAASITVGEIGNGGLWNKSIFNNNACGKILLKRGKLLVSSGHTYANTGFTHVIEELENEGTFTNNGILKYGSTTGNPVINTTDSSVIVNDTLSTIFSYGGTFNGTVNGIFTDEAATVSAGTYLIDGDVDFIAACNLPNGTQTLYASITSSSCTTPVIVPFLYNNVVATPTDLLTWTGAVSTDWNEACNWSPTGIPTATNDVIIPGGLSNQPTISIDTAKAGSMKVQSGAIFTITAGGKLELYGSKANFNIESYTFINSGTVENNGTLTIGIENFIDDYGLVNYFHFNNNVGGEVIIDRSTEAAILNVGTMTNDANITIGSNTGIGDYGFYNLSTFNNSICANLKIEQGKFRNNNGTAVTNLGYVYVADTLENEGTFTNDGLLKYDVQTGNTVTNSTNSSIIVNDTLSTIFSYGGTFNGTVNGIFTDEAATVSAGAFTTPNSFIPLSTLPLGSQTLYAKITPNGNACSHVVPFLFDNFREIDVRSNYVSIANGDMSPSVSDLTDFGVAGINFGTISNIFTIVNEGTSTLTLGANPVTKSGPHVADFTILQPSETTIAPGDSVYFDIIFDPSVFGERNATISIANDDTDENPYTFAILGNSFCNVPSTASMAGTANLTCSITSVTRTTSGGTSYSWSNGLGTNAIANINAAGIYTVTVTAVNGCTSTATTEVTIDNTPPTASISGTDSLNCTQNTVIRTASGGSSYAWSNALGTNATANISAAGTYTVTVTAANGCTSTATAEVVFDNNLVVSASNDGPYNEQETINLMATGGPSYSWTGPDGFTSSLVNPSIANASSAKAGIYTVTVNNGSCTGTATTNVVISCSTPGMSYYLAYVDGAEVEVFAPLVSEMEVQATNRRMTVLAIPNCELPVIESTRLQLSGTGNIQFYNDNEAPYSLYENNQAVYGDVFEANYYTFIARGYAQDNSQGVVVGPDVIRFSVVPGDREITSPSLSTNVICAGASFTVSSTASGVFSFNVGNVYQAFLSDENGSFGNQILIGSSSNPNNISCTIPSNVVGGSNYKVIVRSSSPIVSSDASASLSITSNSLSLLSPTNDVLSGTQTEQAIQTINAENKISGSSNVMYKAGKAILLAPGFSTASGNVFSAKIEDVCAE